MLRTLFVTLALGGYALAANQVLVVGAGQEYSTLDSALLAATEGDTVLVKPGSYGGSTVIGKSVTILAYDVDDTAICRISFLQISDLAPHQTVAVRGLEIRNQLFLTQFAVRVNDCAGKVVFEDCQVESASVHPAVQVTNSQATYVVRGLLVGGKGHSPGHVPAAPALLADDSHVFVYDSMLEGGRGANDHGPNQLYPAVATDGGPGVWSRGGTLFTSGTILSGGDGGDVVSGGAFIGVPPPYYCGDGGEGVRIEEGAIWRRLNSPLIPGDGGVSGIQGSVPGSAGVELTNLDSTALVIPEFARKLEMSTPVRAGATQTLSLQAQPGEPAWLLYSFSCHGAYVSSLKGALQPGLPLQILSLGTVPANGQIHAEFFIPEGAVPPGIDAVVIHEQAMVPSSTGTILLSSPSTVVILASDV